MHINCSKCIATRIKHKITRFLIRLLLFFNLFFFYLKIYPPSFTILKMPIRILEHKPAPGDCAISLADRLPCSAAHFWVDDTILSSAKLSTLPTRLTNVVTQFLARVSVRFCWMFFLSERNRKGVNSV